MDVDGTQIKMVNGVKSTEVGFIDKQNREWVPENFDTSTDKVVVNISSCRIRVQENAWVTFIPTKADTFKIDVYTTQTGPGRAPAGTFRVKNLVPFFKEFIGTHPAGMLPVNVKTVCCGIWLGVPALQKRLNINAYATKYLELVPAPGLLILQSRNHRLCQKIRARSESEDENSDDSPLAKKAKIPDPGADEGPGTDPGIPDTELVQNTTEQPAPMAIKDEMPLSNNYRASQSLSPDPVVTAPSPEPMAAVGSTGTFSKADRTGTGTAQAVETTTSILPMSPMPTTSQKVPVTNTELAVHPSNDNPFTIKAEGLATLDNRYNGSQSPGMVAIIKSEPSPQTMSHLPSLSGLSNQFFSQLDTTTGSAGPPGDAQSGDSGNPMGEGTVDDTDGGGNGVGGDVVEGGASELKMELVDSDHSPPSD